MSDQTDLNKLVSKLVSTLKDVLRGNLEAVYFYGASLQPDVPVMRDLDFHVIVNETLSRETIISVRQVYDSLRNQFSDRFPELDFDGYYILLDSARGIDPPVHLLDTRMKDDAWALHRAHILSGACLVGYGPRPESILLWPEWHELRAALLGELQYVEQNLENYPDYCVLNLSRILYSFKTQDVVISKFAASEWTCKTYSQWCQHLHFAKQSYLNNITPQGVSILKRDVSDMFEFVKSIICET